MAKRSTHKERSAKRGTRKKTQKIARSGSPVSKRRPPKELEPRAEPRREADFGPDDHNGQPGRARDRDVERERDDGSRGENRDIERDPVEDER